MLFYNIIYNRIIPSLYDMHAKRIKSLIWTCPTKQYGMKLIMIHAWTLPESLTWLNYMRPSIENFLLFTAKVNLHRVLRRALGHLARGKCSSVRQDLTQMIWVQSQTIRPTSNTRDRHILYIVFINFENFLRTFILKQLNLTSWHSTKNGYKKWSHIFFFLRVTTRLSKNVGLEL